MPDSPSIEAVARAIELAEKHAEEAVVAIGRLLVAVANAREKNGLHYNATAEAMQEIRDIGFPVPKRYGVSGGSESR